MKRKNPYVIGTRSKYEPRWRKESDISGCAGSMKSCHFGSRRHEKEGINQENVERNDMIDITE